MTARVKRRQFLPSTAALAALVLSVGTSSLSAPSGDNAATPVALLYRAQSGHREAASALEGVLRENGTACVRIELPAGRDPAAEDLALRRLVDARPTVIAAGGTKATSLALRWLPETPVIFFMVPNALDAPFMEPSSLLRKRVAGVTTDVEPDKQISWLATLVPEVRTVALLTSPRTRVTAAKIQTSGRQHSVTVLAIEASKDEFIPAIDALNTNGCDAAVMIADARVYNSASVQRLLLWGLRHKKAVSAFSPHIVKAGALTGQYCDNDAIGQQAARLVLQVMSGADVASMGVQYPDRVHLAVNERTAEMIGIALDRKHLPRSTVRFGNDK